MEIKTRQLSEVQAEITITNTPEEVEKVCQLAHANAAKQIKVHGFRKGKAPSELIEQKFGKQILAESIEALLELNLEECRNGFSPTPISMPSFKVKCFDRKQGASFVATYDFCIYTKLGKYRKLEFHEDIPVIDDTLIEKRLKQLQKEKSLSHSREKNNPREQDIVVLNLTIKDGSKTILHKEDFSVTLDTKGEAIPGLSKEIMSMKVSGRKETTIQIPDDFPDKNYASKKLLFDISLKECRYLELPELNDEFAKDLGNYKNLQECRDQIKEDFQIQAKKAIETSSKRDILNKIVQSSKVILPDSVVQNAIEDEFQYLHTLVYRKPAQKGSYNIEEISRRIDMSPNELTELARKNAKEKLMRSAVIYEIRKKEKLKLNPEFANDYLTQEGEHALAAEIQEKIENDKEIPESIHNGLIYTETVQWLYDNSILCPGKEINAEKLLQQE